MTGPHTYLSVSGIVSLFVISRQLDTDTPVFVREPDGRDRRAIGIGLDDKPGIGAIVVIRVAQTG